jgi:hypothetical protein
VSVAALSAAVLFHAAGPDDGPASRPPLQRLPARNVSPEFAGDTLRADRPRARELPIDAAAIERAESAAEPGTRDLVLERMLATWVREDAPASARYAELQTDPFLREVALRTVAQRWAQVDRAGAAQWATALADDTERDRAIEDVALASSEPREALDLLERRGAEKRPDEARVGVVASWAAWDFAAAQAWAEAQPPGPARDDITQRLVFLRAQTDPLEATKLASAMLDDETARRDAYASIVRLWVTREPEAARAWAASEDAETRRRVDIELTVPRSPAH